MAKITILIGISCSGKTYYANQESKISGAKIISAEKGSFEEMNRECAEMLEAGESVIYDATSMLKKHRAAILRAVPEGVIKEAVVFDTPLGVCLKRNSEKEKPLPELVLRHQAGQLEIPSKEEGFDVIKYERMRR